MKEICIDVYTTASVNESDDLHTITRKDSVHAVVTFFLVKI